MKTEFTEQEAKDLMILLSQVAETLDGLCETLEYEFSELENSKTKIDGVDIESKDQMGEFKNGLEALKNLSNVARVHQYIIEGSDIDTESVRIYDEFHQTIDNR